MPIRPLPILLAIALATPCLAAPQAEPARLTARPVILDGDSPHIAVEGLGPGETVRLHALRRMRGPWAQKADGSWAQGPDVILDAWADFRADDSGRIDVDATTPLAGSYRAADGLGLLWSGYKQGDTALNAVEDARLYDPVRITEGPIHLFLLRGKEIAGEAQIRLATQRAGVAFTPVSQPGVTGVYAAVQGATGLPVVILLHGSEGGSLDGARSLAARFASRGYAALAINYFSWLDQDPNTARAHIEVPIETIEAARDWLEMRPEADVERFAVLGWSKGAEFSLSAAARYPWIDAVVACVPSDLIWEGYGREQNVSVGRSSWSYLGRPLPFVPLYSDIDPAQGDRDNTGRYDRSLRELGDAGGQARIPIERIQGRVLLLGSDRDEVWASGPMTRRLTARAEAAGTADRIEAQIYSTAGHQICGTGSFAARLYNDQSSNAFVKDVTAEGEANIDAWRRTLDFLERTVGPTYRFPPPQASSNLEMPAARP